MATTTEVISSANDLLAEHSALISRVRDSQLSHRKLLQSLPSPPAELVKLPLISSRPPSLSPSPPGSPPLISERARFVRNDLPPAKRARVARYHNYIPEEETIRNDYSQRYVDGGEWPQNWVLGAEPERRFEEYPKQQRLLNLKKAAVYDHALPASYLPFSKLQSLAPAKFDVILLDPPFSSSFTWEDLQELPIPALAADPSFVFLWVGSGAGEGLERGREVLAKWGYRRCEDVCWVKTNKTTNRGPGTDPPTTSLLTRTKQHCLIGIRGTVRRSTDNWFVHCNVDTDVIIWEGDPSDPTRKPPEMYTLIENFCLGIRRLEIFGKRPSSFRRGWLTVLAEGQVLPLQSNFNLDHPKTVSPTATPPSASPVPLEEEITDAEGAVVPLWVRDTWEGRLKELLGVGNGRFVVPSSADIDALRPKSPFRPGQQQHNNSSNIGNNAGAGVFSGAGGNQAQGMGVNLGMGMNMGMNMGMGGQRSMNMNMNGMNPNTGFSLAPNQSIPMSGHRPPVFAPNPAQAGQNPMMIPPGMMGMNMGIGGDGMGVGVGGPWPHGMMMGMGGGHGHGHGHGHPPGVPGMNNLNLGLNNMGMMHVGVNHHPHLQHQHQPQLLQQLQRPQGVNSPGPNPAFPMAGPGPGFGGGGMGVGRMGGPMQGGMGWPGGMPPGQFIDANGVIGMPGMNGMAGMGGGMGMGGGGMPGMPGMGMGQWGPTGFR